MIVALHVSGSIVYNLEKVSILKKIFFIIWKIVNTHSIEIFKNMSVVSINVVKYFLFVYKIHFICIAKIYTMYE